MAQHLAHTYVCTNGFDVGPQYLLLSLSLLSISVGRFSIDGAFGALIKMHALTFTFTHTHAHRWKRETGPTEQWVKEQRVKTFSKQTIKCIVATSTHKSSGTECILHWVWMHFSFVRFDRNYSAMSIEWATKYCSPTFLRSIALNWAEQFPNVASVKHQFKSFRPAKNEFVRKHSKRFSKTWKGKRCRYIDRMTEKGRGRERETRKKEQNKTNQNKNEYIL